MKDETSFLRFAGRRSPNQNLSGRSVAHTDDVDALLWSHIGTSFSVIEYFLIIVFTFFYTP